MGISPRSRAVMASSAAWPPPALSPGHCDSAAIEPKLGGVAIHPSQAGIIVLDRPAIVGFRSEAVFDGHDHAVEVARQCLKAADVAGSGAEDIAAAMRVQDAGAAGTGLGVDDEQFHIGRALRARDGLFRYRHVGKALRRGRPSAAVLPRREH